MGEKALGGNTYEDYLVIEAESEVKYEFHDGHIIAMADIYHLVEGMEGEV